jgi:hypothetical protein
MKQVVSTAREVLRMSFNKESETTYISGLLRHDEGPGLYFFVPSGIVVPTFRGNIPPPYSIYKPEHRCTNFRGVVTQKNILLYTLRQLGYLWIIKLIHCS